MTSGNGDGKFPVEVFSVRTLPPDVPPYYPPLPEPRRTRSLIIAAALFGLTVLSTLVAGTQFALDYARNRPSSLDTFFGAYSAIWREPRLLLAGLPFSFTLIGILLAHELGHYFACRYYGIPASYPYFIPAPTLIGTLGAFIRIRAPIINRKALFDVGLAGPVVGFLFAVPALAIAIAYSKIIPGAENSAPLIFGNPLLSRLLLALLRPGVSSADLLLHPVGRAAWVGLFATALNLLPAGQLDGGHILYALASEQHRRVSLAVATILVLIGGPAMLYAMGVAMPKVFGQLWPGWVFWGVLLLLLRFRHPPLLNRWEPIDRKRVVWAAVALLIFLLCFMPAPFTFND
jgi:membrane-associated protease RseP (regulator of RpoE activity)